MSKGHRTYVTVYNFTPSDFADLDRTVHIESSEFFEEIVPFRHEWGDIAHIELEDLEYDERRSQLSFVCETKWKAPKEWLRSASCTPFFSGKLILAASISSYENFVEGLAFINHDQIQDVVLVDVPHNKIGEMYENDEVDEIDDLLWTPIEQFNRKCEELYIDDFPCAGV